MSVLRAWALRFTGLFDKQRKDRDLSEELESNLQFHIEDNLRRGMTSAKARRDALLKLGGLEQTKEKVRDRRSFPFVESVLQDIRFGLRMLSKSPGFTAVVVLTLALGIGATTYIFSIFNAIILHPFPFRELNHIVALWERTPPMAPPFRGGSTSPANFLDWRAQNTVFDHIAAERAQDVDLGGIERPEHVRAMLVSADFFASLGVAPVLGRSFNVEEELPGKNQVMVISYGVWQGVFASDGAILGKSVLVNGASATVVGVMGPDFDYPASTQVWMPLALAPAAASDRRTPSLSVIAHLRPGITPDRAQTAMSIVAANLSRQYPQADAGRDIDVLPLLESEIGSTRRVMDILFTLVTLVLVIACANVAGLLLSRVALRQREAAIRAVVGAVPSRLLRQFLVESMLLGLFGGGMGVVFAWWELQLQWRRLPAQFTQGVPGADKIGINLSAVIFTLAIALGTVALFGLLPALRTSRPDVNEALKEGTQASGKGRGHSQMRSWLIVSEVALSLALLVPAGFLDKSFARLVDTPLGLNPAHIMTMAIQLPQTKYPTDPQTLQFHRELLSRLGGLPGVDSLAAANQLPLGLYRQIPMVVDGEPVPNPGREQQAGLLSVSSGYFHTLQIPILRGRDFSGDDTSASLAVVAVNEAFVSRHWPDQNPLGKRIRIADASQGEPWRTVVAVVGNVRNAWDAGLPPGPTIYLPLMQQPSRRISLMLRTALDPGSLTEPVRAQVQALDKDQPIFYPMTMDESRMLAVVPEEAEVGQISAFAVVALLLAGVGLYGIVASAVNERTHEIGIRVALGASPRDVLRLTIGTGMKLVLIGLLVGMPLSIALSRIMASGLFGITPDDPTTLLEIVVVLALVGLAACYIPARRATKVDPMAALRCE